MQAARADVWDGWAEVRSARVGAEGVDGAFRALERVTTHFGSNEV